MKYKPSRDLPNFALQYHTLSPTRLAAHVLAERNKKITPQSVSMWFKAHPDTHQELQKAIHDEELPQAEVSPTIFKNGTFEQLGSIKNWLLQLDARELSPDYVKAKLGNLKLACQGKTHDRNFVSEGKMALQHPDRMTLKKAMEIISLVKKAGFDPYYFKRDLKDFLTSKNIVVGKTFVVGKPKGYGKFKDLYVERPILNRMLVWLHNVSLEAYVVVLFMFKTGVRIDATLAARIEKLTTVGQKGVLKVFDKGRRSKYPKGKPHDARLDPTLLHYLKKLVGDRKHGKIFSLTAADMAKLNRQALEQFCPDLLKQYPTLMVNHFWRHMYFQYLLRLCDWNYTVAADLSGSTPQSVRESYGMPPEEIIKTWGEKYYID